MAFFKVEETLAFHPKVLAAGNEAMGLWVRAGAYCTQQLTDGFVPEDIVKTMDGAKIAPLLVKAGLWHKAEGGYTFHEWTGRGRNWTRKQVEANRARDRSRKAPRQRQASDDDGRA